MTEFGKAVKEVDKMMEDLKELAKRIGAALDGGKEEEINDIKETLEGWTGNIGETGSLGMKAAKFKKKAEEPAESRLYSDKMVEKVENFLKTVEKIREDLKTTVSPITEWIENKEHLARVLAEIAERLEYCLADEAACRASIAFETSEATARLTIENNQLVDVSAELNVLQKALRELERKAAAKERKKQKKREQQAQLRGDAEKRKVREKEEQQQQMAEAFEKALRQVERKEISTRVTLTEEEQDNSLSILNAFYKVIRRTKSPTKPGRAGQRKSPPGGRVTPPRGDRPKSPKSRSGRDKRASKGQGGAEGVSADLFDLPPGALDMVYDVKAIPNTPSVQLSNSLHNIELTVYKCLLSIRDVAEPIPFELPPELLTDRKAKKRYESGKVHHTAQSSLATYDEGGIEGDDDDEDDLLGNTDSDDDDLFIEDYEQEEEEDKRALPENLNVSFLKRLTGGCVVVMMSVGGSFAGGIFMGGDCIVHTTFSRYITRKKQGGRQSNHEGRSDTMGSQLRKSHETRFKELISQLLHTWALPLNNASAIFLHAPSPVNRMPFYSVTPLPPSNTVAHGLKKTDPRILPVPLTTKKPTFTEVQKVYSSLVSCVYKSS